MECNIYTKTIVYDNIINIEKSINKGDIFKILAYDGCIDDDEKPAIGIFIESNGIEDATLMIDITLEDAEFFAKSMLNIIEQQKLK
jgi:hypothetical protein